MEEKRIVSTVILIIFLVIVCFLCWLDITCLVFVGDYSPDISGQLGDVEGEEKLVIGIIAGIAAIAPYFFILVGSVILIILSAPCLIFSIRNTRVRCKPVRIINIVLSCIFAAAVALGIIAIILFKVL